MEHVWTLIARKVVRDPITNMVSLIDLCDKIETSESNAPTYDPQSSEVAVVGPVELKFVSFWMRSDYAAPEKGWIRNVLVAPDGTRFEQDQQEIDLTEGVTKRFMLVANKLPTKGFGLYFVETEQWRMDKKEWVSVAKVPLLFDIQRADDTRSRTEEKVRKKKKKKRRSKKKPDA